MKSLHFYSSQPIAYPQKGREILPKAKGYYRGFFLRGPPPPALSPPGRQAAPSRGGHGA